MKHRSLLIIFAVLLLMILPATIGAQDISETEICFGLDEADCLFLDSASDNMDSLSEAGSSFTLEYDLDFSMSGLTEELPLPLPEEFMGLLDGQSSFAFVSSGAVDIVIGDDGEPETFGAVLDIAYGEADSDELVAVPVEMRMVDNTLYMLNPESGTWQGASLDIGETDVELMAEIESMPINPMTGELNTGMTDMIPDTETLHSIDLAGLAELPGLATQVREGDDFILTIEFSALSELLEEENAELFEEIAASLAAIDQGLGFMFVMLPAMPFEEGSMTIVQHVDTDLNIIDSIDVSLALNVNLMQFMGQVDGEPITMYLDFAADISNVGSAPAAVAPAEFEEVDLLDLLGGI